MRLKNNFVYFIIDEKNTSLLLKHLQSFKIEYNLIYGKNQLIFKTNINNYKRFKKLFPQYKIRIVDCTGTVYLGYLLKKYYLSVISLILSISIVILCSNIIVDVVIETSDLKLKELVKESLSNNDIKPFTFKKSYDEMQLIKDEVKKQNENQIDWMEIQEKGMKYYVNVEKKEINPIEPNHNYCNVYAKKDGMIKRSKVYKGISVVDMNDYVQKGSLLISGNITANDRVVNQVCADGAVYAEVWYIVNIKTPLTVNEYISTGKTRKNIVIRTENYNFQLFKNRLEKYESSDTPLWEILGVKISIRNDMEIKKIEKHLSLEEATNNAIKKAVDNINVMLEKDEKIIKQKVLQKQVIDNIMDIDIFIITEENIGYMVVEG